MGSATNAASLRLSSISSDTKAAPYLLLIVGLVALRFATAAYLPLSFDEAYFWLWSRRLALSYFEHPPLLAFAIRAGTALLGDTSLGVRLVSLLASLLASWAVWRAAAVLLDRERAWLACAFFNLSLMVASQGIAATPDVFVMAASALLLRAVAELDRAQDPYWWLLVAAALGVALLAKYTAFFLALSLVIWLVLSRNGRRWLRSPWPYAAAALAVCFLIPNLLWNQAHAWASFHYQFGRIVAGRPTHRHVLEFVAGQLALASPFMLALAILALVRETRAWAASRMGILVALVWPAILYFLVHSLHDRVQGNWPSFVYPALTILAASAVPPSSDSTRVRWLVRPAIPAAVCILLVSDVQMFTALLPLGKADPIARMTAVGFEPVANDIWATAKAERAAALVTTRYVNTGWLAFYVRPHLPVLQAAEEYRWTDSPAASGDLLKKPLLYVTQSPDREIRLVQRYFTNVTFETCIPRVWGGVRVDSFCLYRLGGFRGARGSRIPVAYDPGPGVPVFGILRPAQR